MRRGLIGIGHRARFARWLEGGAAGVECVELTAEHFFDAPDSLLKTIGGLYPCSVHGLGLSLGTPGPLDEPTLRAYGRVARLSRARWVSEHVAFTRAGGIDLGHLNPIAPTERNLSVLIEHALMVHELTGCSVCLENITTELRLEGDLTETEFLNRLCAASPHIRLLLDVTNLFINARNHRFDASGWLAELEPRIVSQIHVVGFSEHHGRLTDDHRRPVQPEILALMAVAADRHQVDAVILERDLDIPEPSELIAELSRVRQSLGWN